jgi:putative membrane protein
MTLNAILAAVNAALSLATIALLLSGWRAIRRRDIASHRARMIGAFGCSAGFLAVFAYRFVVYGFQPLAAGGAWRGVYYTMLFAHEPIAVISVPMGVITVVSGLRRSRFHTELARPTLWIWLVSAVTGVLLYTLLYWVPTH